MLKGLTLKKESTESVKCVKCGKRNATNDDKLCDNCRFLSTLENIISNRK